MTGGGGFIGSALARALAAGEASDVKIVDNFITGRRDAVPPGVEVVEADIRDRDAMTKAFDGADVVFHQAAIRSVPKSVDDPFLSNSCNVEGTLSVLAAATDAGIRRLVYASSSSVYGDSGGRVTNEDMPTAPQSPYAVSKLAGENYCRVWSALGRLSTVSLRYFNVFGPGQHPESKYSAVFPAFVSALVVGEAPEVHWDGEQSRDFTFIDDVVAANIAAARVEDPGADGSVLNVASGRPKTVNGVLEAVSAAVGTWIEPKRVPRRAGDVRSTAADISRAADLLGWSPRVEWDEAVERTVDFFKNLPH